jgi:tetratricopeptide (TPR) repeat protein
VSVLEQIHDVAGEAGARGDVARTLAVAGKTDEAIAEQEKAIALYEKLGDDGLPRLSPALSDLAGFWLDEHHPERALPIAQRALSVAEARPADANAGDLADARFAVAAALWDTHGDRARARHLAEQARDGETDAERKQAIVDWLGKHAL